MYPRGSRENPLSVADLRRKFALNASGLLPAERADGLADAILALDRAAAIRPVLELARPATPAG